jgi:hypothetical protein
MLGSSDHVAPDRFTIDTEIGRLTTWPHEPIVIKITIGETIAIFTPRQLRSAGEEIVERLALARALGASDGDINDLRNLAAIFASAANDADMVRPERLH